MCFSIFEMLQRLLKSRKPEDLEQANQLIKSLVKKVQTTFEEKHLFFWFL